MNENSLLKKIEKLINPIRKDVGTLKSDVGTLKSDIKTVKETLEGHTETLETHTTSLLKIETTINAYGDMYKINDDNIRKIEKRTKTLEDNAGIEAPEELTLLKVQ